MTYDYDSATHRLRLAAKSGDLAAVRTLLETEPDIDIDAAPSPRTTAFKLAMGSNHWEVVRVLLQYGATVTLDDAYTLEALNFLMAHGVAEPTGEQKESNMQYDLKRGWISEQDIQIALGRLPDPTLTVQITPETVEAEIDAEAKIYVDRLDWEMMKARMQIGDELWKIDTNEHDEMFGGIRRRGYVLRRQGKLVIRIGRSRYTDQI